MARVPKNPMGTGGDSVSVVQLTQSLFMDHIAAFGGWHVIHLHG